MIGGNSRETMAGFAKVMAVTGCEINTRSEFPGVDRDKWNNTEQREEVKRSFVH